jgi:hypothetical protein
LYPRGKTQVGEQPHLTKSNLNKLKFSPISNNRNNTNVSSWEVTQPHGKIEDSKSTDYYLIAEVEGRENIGERVGVADAN